MQFKSKLVYFEYMKSELVRTHAIGANQCFDKAMVSLIILYSSH